MLVLLSALCQKGFYGLQRSLLEVGAFLTVWINSYDETVSITV